MIVNKPSCQSCSCFYSLWPRSLTNSIALGATQAAVLPQALQQALTLTLGPGATTLITRFVFNIFTWFFLQNAPKGCLYPLVSSSQSSVVYSNHKHRGRTALSTLTHFQAGSSFLSFHACKSKTHFYETIILLIWLLIVLKVNVFITPNSLRWFCSCLSSGFLPTSNPLKVR